METELNPDRTDMQTFGEEIIQLILLTTPFNTYVYWTVHHCDS